jgi:hypothetical protein
MKRTVCALYETRAEAERARDALQARHLGGEVEIHDLDEADRKGKHGLLERLGHLFGGHKDTHLYGEGLRRGHVLLTAKVDDDKETLAAELMEAAQPLNLPEREHAWRAEGWTPPADSTAGVETHPSFEPGYEATSFGSPIRVRSYVAGSTVDYS